MIRGCENITNEYLIAAVCNDLGLKRQHPAQKKSGETLQLGHASKSASEKRSPAR